MSLLKWHDRYATGIAEIDEQHQSLFAAIRDLYEALAAGRDAGNTLLFLTGYTVRHFADEERLMAQKGFPGLAQHQAGHNQLIQDLMRQETLMAANDRLALLAFAKFVSDWLNQHILEDDMAFITWLQDGSATT